MARNEKIDIFEERTRNGLLLSTVTPTRRINQLYCDYTKKEARQRFRQYVREEMKKDGDL